MPKIKSQTQHLLSQLNLDPDFINGPEAFSLREDGQTVACQSTDHIQVKLRPAGGGLDIYISSEAQNETVSIPACITTSGHEEVVVNNFYIEPGAKVLISAGCAIHATSEATSHHQGQHHFYIGEQAQVTYVEHHFAQGWADSPKIIDPFTQVELKAGAVFNMETIQLAGVTASQRRLVAQLSASSKLQIQERIITHDQQLATTDYQIDLDGQGCRCDLVSRSVAKNSSQQVFTLTINGNADCFGHSECDAIVSDQAMVKALPALVANHPDAQLVHEAAIGKIAADQIIKLQTLGLTQEQAEAKIIAGFLQ